MYKIYLVEDDETIAGLLCENLEKWGFEPFRAADFSDIAAEFARIQPHLVLMDISLPYYNGYYWCAELRKTSKVPILFLSSHTENMDIVMAVNMGGDDYITKPFSMEVLIAKVNAALRRAYHYADEPAVLEARGALLNPAEGTLRCGDSTLPLTKNEQRILLALITNKNRIVSREEIMKALWDSDSFIDDNTLTVNINRLRQKLSEAGLDDLITTKKGQGYLIHD